MPRGPASGGAAVPSGPPHIAGGAAFARGTGEEIEANVGWIRDNEAGALAAVATIAVCRSTALVWKYFRFMVVSAGR